MNQPKLYTKSGMPYFISYHNGGIFHFINHIHTVPYGGIFHFKNHNDYVQCVQRRIKTVPGPRQGRLTGPPC